MSAAGLQCEKESDHISEAQANTALACWFVPTEGLHNSLLYYYWMDAWRCSTESKPPVGRLKQFLHPSTNLHFK